MTAIAEILPFIPGYVKAVNLIETLGISDDSRKFLKQRQEINTKLRALTGPSTLVGFDFRFSSYHEDGPDRFPQINTNPQIYRKIAWKNYGYDQHAYSRIYLICKVIGRDKKYYAAIDPNPTQLIIIEDMVKRAKGITSVIINQINELLCRGTTDILFRQINFEYANHNEDKKYTEVVPLTPELLKRPSY